MTSTFTHPAFRPKPSPATPHIETPEFKAANGHKPSNNLEGYIWNDDFDEPKKTITYKEPIKKAIPKELLNAPGLVGQLNKFINKTSLMPQPILALGAAIATAGALMGRKVRSDTNLRTNFYIIGLAPSGAGKDHARSIVKRILNNSGNGNLELGIPASSAGMITGLRKRGEGRGLILWDEFGRVLKQISSWKSGSHEKDIVTAMLELFSSSQSVYMGKQYADHDGKNPMQPIDQPCLSIYGTSVPSHFYEALSGGEAIDGFLSRWMLFESEEYTIEEEDRDISFEEIPADLLEVAKYWKAQPSNSDTKGGNMEDVSIINPRLVPSSKAAATLLKDYATEMRKRTIEAEKNRLSTGSIWARSAEHARRLALVAHEGDVIELKIAEWAIKLGRYCSEYMAGAILEHVSSSELESQTKRILYYIKNHNNHEDSWISRSDITRAFQGIQTRVRTEILASLCERKEIEEGRDDSGLGRTSIRYRAI